LPRATQAKAATSSGRTAAGDAFSGLVVYVLRLHGLLTAAGDELARPAGQTSARWQVLAAVEDRPKTVAHIARILGLARQSVQRVADVLERDGLAEYEANPDHLRAKLLKLTPSGHSALRSIQSKQRIWADALGAQIGEAKLRQAVTVLADVFQKLQTND
jgi:DNA-binding MarR family transcriptional regulator